MADIKDHSGFSPVAVDYDNAINVVGTHRPVREAGRSLILNGHIDVVPVGPLDMWAHPPFEPRIEGGWLYGRGSGDIKAGLAANVFALDALRRRGYQPAATLHLQSVTEEECTGNGALSSLVRGYTADAALIPEPENDMLVRANCGVDPGDAAREIQNCLREASKANAFLASHPPEVDYNGFFARGYVLEEGSDVEATLSDAHQRSFGKPLESFTTAGYLDGRVFVLYRGCPCLVYGPLAENIHTFDERVSLSSLKRITGAIALFVADWCGLEPAA